MTERQQDESLLADLLRIPSDHDLAGAREDTRPGVSGASYPPILTPAEEQTLLKEANQADPPTLAPADTEVAHAANTSFPAEVAETIRRHPIPALLLGIGLAYLLTRRHR